MTALSPHVVDWHQFVPLSDAEQQSILHAIEHSPQVCAVSRLQGRSALIPYASPTWGKCLIKPYRRGGTIAALMGAYHMVPNHNSMRRGVSEGLALESVRSAGVSAPRPIAALWTRGWPFYRAWLVMQEVEGATPLSELAQFAPERLPVVFEALLRQLDLLVSRGMLHTDLHPGNVLVTAGNEVVLVDFDKSRHVSLAERSLRHKYLNRWRRAVIKHHLPDTLTEFFAQGMRRL